MKFLIVGLGNPGSEYKNTRHNIGFDVLDSLAKDKEQEFKSLRYGDICKVKHKGRSLILLKPSTFMNLSGKAVSYWMQHEKVPPSNLLVVTDDLALPLGKLRLRGKGSAGGHNGLKNISYFLETDVMSLLVTINPEKGEEFESEQVSYVINGKECKSIFLEAISRLD